jgi:hypothetical protein
LGYEKIQLAHTVNEMLETKITVNPYGENVTRKTVDVLIRIVEGKIRVTSQPIVEKVQIPRSVTNG